MNSLALDKNPADTRVIVAMSGGVDSSATAAMLVEQGYDVVGITLQLYDHGQAISKPGTCCAGKDIHDARRVADTLGVPHYVINMEDTFRRDVIEDFADTYSRGETPIPCIRCNETVKFRDLLGKTIDLDGDLLVTGHYVRWAAGAGGSQLLRGADHGRDQSYFLFATTRTQLDMLRFPLGDMTKDETRAIARRFDLPVASKPDSQDICFIPDGKYAELLRKMRPATFAPGAIVDEGGQVLGEHDGIVNYTVGQRRGLGIGGGDRLYVLKIDAPANRVIVGPKSSLYKSSLVVHGVNWLGDQAVPAQGMDLTVKLRSLHHPVAAHITRIDEARVRIDLADPQAGIAPGQAGVFYDAERVLGGGWIESDDDAKTGANG